MKSVCTCLGDTGACMCVCSMAFCKQFKLVVVPSSQSNLRSACGKSLPVRGRTKLFFILNQRVYCIWFVVLEVLTTPIILGRDFLFDYNIMVRVGVPHCAPKASHSPHVSACNSVCTVCACCPPLSSLHCVPLCPLGIMNRVSGSCTASLRGLILWRGHLLLTSLSTTPHRFHVL